MSDSTEKGKSEKNPLKWLVRPCPIYREEYDDCTSIRGRFHQYFIHGTPVDCVQWLRDADNCKRWEENEDKKALEQLIESEKTRRTARLQSYVNNNVMSIRETPPKNWNDPLPEWMEKEYGSTYLAMKSVERLTNKKEDTSRLCIIL